MIGCLLYGFKGGGISQILYS